MSKEKENYQAENESGDFVPENDQMKSEPADSNSKGRGNKKDDLTIEEHKASLNIEAPVFAAVMQLKGWCPGKRMPETVFTKAVEEFLGAPMGGK